MLIKAFLFAALLVLITGATPVRADIHKCVGPSGTPVYSDQPCAATNGEKAVDSTVGGVDHQDQIAKSCYALNDRKAHCGAIDHLLQTKFQENCSNPLLRYQAELRQPKPVNRYLSPKERQQAAIDNMQVKTAADYRCESIQKDTWSFLKEKFSKKISPEDAKAIDYRLQAIPGDGRDNIRLRNGMRD